MNISDTVRPVPASTIEVGDTIARWVPLGGYRLAEVLVVKRTETRRGVVLGLVTKQGTVWEGYPHELVMVPAV